MDNVFNARVAAVLGALLPEAEHPCPASVIYMAMGHNIRIYEEVVGAMVAARYIIRTSSTIKLTPDGVRAAEATEKLFEGVKETTPQEKVELAKKLDRIIREGA